MSDELRNRFPDMRPITSAPGLATINGIGMTLAGRRDYDPDTGTYVTTHAFSVLFIPLIAVGAYRVADAPGGGWYFVGKVPLSRFAKRWNLGLFLAVVALVGGLMWRSHVNSPEYLAAVRVEESDRAAAAGQFGKAAEGYRDVIVGPTPKAAEAKQKFATLLGTSDGSGVELAAAYKVAADLNRSGRGVVPDLYATGAGQAEKRSATDPAGALAVLEAVSPLAPNPTAPLAIRRSLLERLTVANPNDPDFASKLAVVYEATGDRAKCESLLTPHASRLGTRDGAAVLGRIYASQGKLDPAIALLRPYIDAKLPALRQAETGFDQTADAAEKRVFESLKGGSAPGFDYASYDKSPKPRQQAMVRDYVSAALKDDPAIRNARQALADVSGVVPAALDLGLVYLQRGQSAADPAARNADFKEAEATFLSIRTFAGESDAFRLSLGQVCHWLGKPADAKKEFDAVLAAKSRSTDALLTVANVLREVGAVTEARVLAEEAYAKETDQRKKYTAAHSRALMFVDLDDDIAWLSKADPDDPSVQANLSSVRAHKAMRDGKDDEAVRLFRDSLDIQAKFPENAATLNNSALVHFDLSHLTHDPQEFARGVDKLDRAIALKPSDSILLHNSASVVLEAALRDAVADKLDLKTLKRRASFDLLPFLFADAAAKQAVAEKLRSHPGMVKARGYFEKLILLSPKRSESYTRLADMYAALRDPAGLKSVATRIAAADLDRTQEEKEYREFVAGASLAKRKDEFRQTLARAKESLEAVKARKDATFAVAAGRVVTLAVLAAMLGEPVDPNATVEVAEKAFANSPSDGSRQALQTALQLRAHVRLGSTSPEYRKLSGETARTLGAQLLEYVLLSGGPTAEAAAGLDDVKRWRELVKAASEKGAELGPSSWAILVGFDAPAATALAKVANADELATLGRTVHRTASPYLPSEWLTEYFAGRMAGNADAATALGTLRKQGVDLPAPR